MAWIDLPEHPQVSDIPPATYWWKDHRDRYTIHLLGDKAGEVIAARSKLRDAILDARAWLDANLGAVGVYLDENPLRATFDVNAHVDPGVDSVWGGGGAGANVGVLNSRQQTELAVFPHEAQRSLNDHQVPHGLATHFDPHACVVRLALAWVATRLTDLVDGAGLAGLLFSWQGEVGIAAFIGQNLDLIAHATTKASWVAVVECPVAVDERPNWFAIGIDRQGAMVSYQHIGKAAELLA